MPQREENQHENSRHARQPDQVFPAFEVLLHAADKRAGAPPFLALHWKVRYAKKLQRVLSRPESGE
jgi:hypothetical protein